MQSINSEQLNLGQEKTYPPTMRNVLPSGETNVLTSQALIRFVRDKALNGLSCIIYFDSLSTRWLVRDIVSFKTPFRFPMVAVSPRKNFMFFEKTLSVCFKARDLSLAMSYAYDVWSVGVTKGRTIEIRKCISEIVVGLTEALRDAEYNVIVGQGDKRKEMLEWNIPAPFKLRAVEASILDAFRLVFTQWYSSPVREEKGFRPTPVGPRCSTYWGNHFPSDMRRNQLSPDDVLFFTSSQVTPVVHPFPKQGVRKSDGSLRTVYSNDYTYEAYLRSVVTRKQCVPTMQGYVLARSHWDLPVCGQYKYSYDIKSCEDFVNQMLHHSLDKDILAKLVPKSVVDGLVYTAKSYPSGTLLTTVMCHIAVCAILKDAGVKEAVIWGDAFLLKSKLQSPYVRRDKVGINGFAFDANTSLWNFSRASEKIRRAAYIKSYKHLTGAQLYVVRYKAYMLMGATAGDFPVGLDHDLIMRHKAAADLVNLSLSDIYTRFNKLGYAVPNSMRYALRLPNEKNDYAGEGFFTKLAPKSYQVSSFNALT